MSVFSALAAHNRAIAAGFTPIHSQVVSHLQQQQAHNMQQLQSMGVQGAVDFMRQSMERFNDFAFGEAARKIEALRNKAGNLFQENRITAIHDIGDMQNAPDIMIDYIMAVPEVRDAYAQGLINGYEGRYQDIQPLYAARDHVLYRQMVNGMMESYTDYHGATTYRESYSHDRELNFEERCRIRQTAQSIADMVIHGVCDPTDEWNNLM